ncbi:hypothetical protein ACOSP7_019470 [Xanthoceras sorbifolium]
MGSIILFSVAVLTYYCMMLLVHTRRRLETPHVFSKIASFGDLGFAVCGSISRLSVDVMIVLAHAGFWVGMILPLESEAKDQSHGTHRGASLGETHCILCHCCSRSSNCLQRKLSSLYI